MTQKGRLCVCVSQIVMYRPIGPYPDGGKKKKAQLAAAARPIHNFNGQ